MSSSSSSLLRPRRRSLGGGGASSDSDAGSTLSEGDMSTYYARTLQGVDPACVGCPECGGGRSSRSSSGPFEDALISTYRRRGLKRAATLKLLPSRLMSRIYGAVNHMTLPTAARPFVYGAWSWFFKVRTDEMSRPFAEYPSLTAFFTRTLREGVRPIDPGAALVSPVDGKVVSVSTDMTATGVLSQVKGIEYHIGDFLGIPTPPLKPGNALFSAVLYLSPGDYHRFHSPGEWVASSRTHFAGQLLPVNPIVARLLPSLFCANERVAVFGEWGHGFFSYTAVGATNVGSIKLSFDPTVRTNAFKHDWQCGFNAWEAMGWATTPKQLAALTKLPKQLPSALKKLPVGMPALRMQGWVPRGWSTAWRGKGGAAGGSEAASGGAGAAAAASAPSPAAPPSSSTAAPSAPASASPYCRPNLVDAKAYPDPVVLRRGDDVGMFELGSTVVLIFEAPADFRFTIHAGDTVRLGQRIGHFSEPRHAAMATVLPGEAVPEAGSGAEGGGAAPGGEGGSAAAGGSKGSRVRVIDTTGQGGVGTRRGRGLSVSLEMEEAEAAAAAEAVAAAAAASPVGGTSASAPVTPAGGSSGGVAHFHSHSHHGHGHHRCACRCHGGGGSSSGSSSSAAAPATPPPSSVGGGGRDAFPLGAPGGAGALPVPARHRPSATLDVAAAARAAARGGRGRLAPGEAAAGPRRRSNSAYAVMQGAGPSLRWAHVTAPGDDDVEDAADAATAFLLQYAGADTETAAAAVAAAAAVFGMGRGGRGRGLTAEGGGAAGEDFVSCVSGELEEDRLREVEEAEEGEEGGGGDDAASV